MSSRKTITVVFWRSLYRHFSHAFLIFIETVSTNHIPLFTNFEFIILLIFHLFDILSKSQNKPTSASFKSASWSSAMSWSSARSTNLSSPSSACILMSLRNSCEGNTKRAQEEMTQLRWARICRASADCHQLEAGGTAKPKARSQVRLAARPVS